MVHSYRSSVTEGVCRLNVSDALSAIIKGSGRSMQSLSLLMGRSRSYLVNTVQTKTNPHVSTMAEIADTCGYDLKLVKRDGMETIIIDPPKREVSNESSELDKLVRKLE